MARRARAGPGFSRRAQYGLFIGYVVAVAGIVLAGILLILAAVDPGSFATVKGAALDVTSPVTGAARRAVGSIDDLSDTIGDYWRAGRQNADLRREVIATRQALIAARAIRYENQRLKALLAVREAGGSAPVATARIVGSSFDSARRLAVLAAGRSEGVVPGQSVRGPEGLIGRVVEAGRWGSRVQLVTDGASNVPVRLLRDGTPAIASGRGDGTIDLKTLEVGRNPFRRGDILVTSGTGGLYPPNIPVAIVAVTRGEETIARPIADPARIDFAIVLPIFSPDAPVEGEAEE